MSDVDVAKDQMDERRIARGVAIGLPLSTITLSLAAGIVMGVPIAVLVLAAGALLGVIALLWASLRVLSGDATLPPEIEALDVAAYGVDSLASRRKMLLRALKDLDNERALGKLDEEDHEQIAATYRGELKEVLRAIDASLEPFRGKAEKLARDHMLRVGVTEPGYRGAQPSDDAPTGKRSDKAGAGNGAAKGAKAEKKPARVTCAKCKASNEPDAKFCKGCGAGLASKAEEARERDVARKTEEPLAKDDAGGNDDADESDDADANDDAAGAKDVEEKDEA